MLIKIHGFPRDGRYEFKLSPNGRKFKGTVFANRLKFDVDMYSIPLYDALCVEDEYIKLYTTESK